MMNEMDAIDKGNYEELINYYGEDFFNDFLKEEVVEKNRLAERITDINIYSGKDGNMYVRCKIDEEQQMGQKLSKKDVLSFGDDTDRVELAARYFKDALDNAQERNQGMKR